MQMAGGIKLIEETITIPANTIDRMNGVVEFFKNATQADVILEATLVESPTVGSQFYSCVYNTTTLYFTSSRWRDGTLSDGHWAPDGYAYLGYIVEGTHYNVKYLKGVQ